MWAVSAPDVSETSTETANIIRPPVTYGQLPPGAEQSGPAAALVPGRTYEVILWKVVSAGSTISCLQRVQNACLLAVTPFTR